MSSHCLKDNREVRETVTSPARDPCIFLAQGFFTSFLNEQLRKARRAADCWDTVKRARALSNREWNSMLGVPSKARSDFKEFFGGIHGSGEGRGTHEADKINNCSR